MYNDTWVVALACVGGGSAQALLVIGSGDINLKVSYTWEKIESIP